MLRVRTGSVLPLRLIDLHEDVLPMLYGQGPVWLGVWEAGTSDEARMVKG